MYYEPKCLWLYHWHIDKTYSAQKGAEKGNCLYYCHHNQANARVHPLHTMNYL